LADETKNFNIILASTFFRLLPGIKTWILSKVAVSRFEKSQLGDIALTGGYLLEV
jgi:hypothetical protein